MLNEAISWVWARCDTQIVGALIQVVAAILVAIAVNCKGNKDRAAALAIEYEREWNSPDMMIGRAAIENRLTKGSGHPTHSDGDFAAIWLVIMFFKRAAALKRSRMFDRTLFADMIQTDAGRFCVRIRHEWGPWGFEQWEHDALAPKKEAPST